MANDNGFAQLALGGFNGGVWPDSPDPTGPNDEGFTQPPATNFPNTHCIWGINMFNQLPDVVERSYEIDPDSAIFAITPSDTVALATHISQFYLGTAGAVRFKTEAGETVTLAGLTAGVLHTFPFTIVQIFATGTTATLIVGVA